MKSSMRKSCFRAYFEVSAQGPAQDLALAAVSGITLRERLHEGQLPPALPAEPVVLHPLLAADPPLAAFVRLGPPRQLELSTGSAPPTAVLLLAQAVGHHFPGTTTPTCAPCTARAIWFTFTASFATARNSSAPSRRSRCQPQPVAERPLPKGRRVSTTAPDPPGGEARTAPRRAATASP